MEPSELESEILATLRPAGISERLRQVFARGLSAVQIWERLPEATQAALRGEGEDIVAARRGLDLLARTLVRMSAEGRLRRRRVRYGIVLNTKGMRGMLVDVYRPA